MKRMQIITAAIMALLALTAITAIASAAEKTLILPEPTTAKPTTFTAKSPEGKLETVNGKTVKCKKDTGKGTFTTPNLGSGVTLFEECTSSLSTVCTGVGDTSGTIEVPGTIHYILALEMLHNGTSTLVASYAFLVHQFHFTCSGTIELLVLSRGCLAGRDDSNEKLTSLDIILFQEFTKGENTILSILMENNTKAETKCLLESTISEEKTGEKFELSELVGEADLEKWTQGGVAITVLLMDK